ncbi:hypothetical protein [Actinoplanes utahensis]|uniref:Uncharacterized protein n=1 Tax=Actinoplanes utahensis TaxID=1869 RepID=A0A0A6UNS5_ACTUT|nr:hypothetical protein [Actinoplanes utahensis]KHD76728.1 hypothetical protein MB27_15700 [Actinoplanes utahensis]GIF33210.1 hypothetical protein Aut01nite_61960 [Actinoplanes utahensis]
MRRADGAAEDTARRFLQAVADGDGQAACRALAPRTAEEIDAPCAESILGESLAAPSPRATTEVYGQRALVTFDGDAVFLAVFPDGWRVVAAGCTPRGEQPYDCAVQGG